MGLRDLFRREKALTASPAVIEAARAGNFTYQRLGGVNQQVQQAWLQSQNASYAYMYERQPAVRKVVDYIANNVQQLGLKLYERKDDNERERSTDHPAARTMAYPNDLGPANKFIFDFVADFLVHENAYALKFRADPRKLTLIRVPPWAIGVNSDGRYLIESYRVYRSDGTFIDVAPEDVIHWKGYNPSDPRIGHSRLETLRLILAEDAASQSANVELLKSGLSKPGYIKRPLDAPEWDKEAMERFQQAWVGQMKSSNRKTPILEDGMEFADFGVSPKDAEMLDGRRFTNEEVASLYGLTKVPAETEEERKMFYTDVLPPITQSLAAQLDFSLLLAEYDAESYYFEFDLNEKLRGDPEKRFAAITSAVGAPWLLRDEARAFENLPKIEGGDQLITPLNVIEGDNPRPAPNVMPAQDPNGSNQDGSHRESALPAPSLKRLEVTNEPKRYGDLGRQARNIDKSKAMLERYYARQGRVLKSKGVKAADSERWNKELADDVEDLVKSIIELEGGIYTARLGGQDFDMRLVDHYVRAMAEGTAEGLNGVTQKDIEELGVSDAIARAKVERAPVAAASIGTRATTFARIEAAKQSPGSESRQQTWISNTKRHANLEGASVPLGETWGGITPGSEPGCQCSLTIT